MGKKLPAGRHCYLRYLQMDGLYMLTLLLYLAVASRSRYVISQLAALCNRHLVRVRITAGAQLTHGQPPLY